MTILIYIVSILAACVIGTILGIKAMHGHWAAKDKIREMERKGYVAGFFEWYKPER